jgi:hypothetical protein
MKTVKMIVEAIKAGMVEIGIVLAVVAVTAGVGYGGMVAQDGPSIGGFTMPKDGSVGVANQWVMNEGNIGGTGAFHGTITQFDDDGNKTIVPVVVKVDRNGALLTMDGKTYIADYTQVSSDDGWIQFDDIQLYTGDKNKFGQAEYKAGSQRRADADFDANDRSDETK